MILCRPIVRAVATVAVLTVVTVAAGCTSSTDTKRSSGSAAVTSPATTSSSPSSSSATSSGPESSGSTANGLSGVDGSYVLAGASDDSAVLYRITNGRVVKAGSATGITSVSTSGATVVVGLETADAETVRQLRGTRLVGLGIKSGFGPAVSANGALAWASLGASTTPGISKPGGSIVTTRTSLTGPDREVATFPTSISGPVWAGEDLVVAVTETDGTTARIVRFASGRGTGRTVARVANADALDLTAGESAVTVATDDGARVVSLRNGRQTAFATGWQPLCWTGGSVLASQGGQLATVPITTDGSAGTPRVLGQLPEGVRAFDGACG